MTPPGTLAGLLDFLLPAGCIACGTWIPSAQGGGLVCGTCRSRLSPGGWPRCPRCHLPQGTGRAPAATCRACASWPETLSAARWAVALQPPADTLVHALKYEGWRGLAEEMGAAMARLPLPRNVLRDKAVLVPVPTTAERLRIRGYNQAGELAQSVSRRLEIPVMDALSRTRSGVTQVALHPSERWANVRGAFAPRGAPEGLPQGVHAILVDDVLTTGSTAAAAASVLVEMGVCSVTLLTFARALPDRARQAA